MEVEEKDLSSDLRKQIAELESEVAPARAACREGRLPYRMQTGYISREAFNLWIAKSEDHLNHSWWEEGHVDVMEGCHQAHGFVKGRVFSALDHAYGDHGLVAMSGALDGINPDVMVSGLDVYPVVAEIGYSQRWVDLHRRRDVLIRVFPGVQYVVLVKAESANQSLSAEVWRAEPLALVSKVVNAQALVGPPANLTIPAIVVADGAPTPELTVNLRAWADMLVRLDKWRVSPHRN
jgi:hypothetical protein